MIRKGTVTIRETESGWDLFWPHETKAEHHASATEALDAVKGMARVLVGGGVSSIFTVEWSPVSSVGRAAVAAVSSKD
jgi:hypothetical protein